MKRYSSLTLALAVLLFAAGCSNDNGTATTEDTQAPTVSILSPAMDDTVGISTVSVVVNATDNVAVTKVELFLDGGTAAVTTVTATPWQATIAIGSLQNGNHTVSAKAYDAAGNSATSQSVLFVKGEKQIAVVTRMSLVEIVTSANCTPCGPANEYFRSMTHTAAYLPQLAVIKYHAPIPRSTDKLWKASQTWGLPRMTYLFSPIPFANASAPNTWVGGTAAGSVPQDWVSLLDDDMKKAAEAKIEVSSDGLILNPTVTITVTGINTGQYTDLRLHTIITESNIEYNDGNSELIHYEVMRQMFPDADGEPFVLTSGQQKNFTRMIPINSEWNRANLDVVVFVQSQSSKFVLQAARVQL